MGRAPAGRRARAGVNPEATVGRSFDRAVARARRPGLAPLWDELARRYGASDAPVAAVTLRNLDGAARRALADLLASDRLPATRTRIGTGRIAAALGIEPGALRDVVEDIAGPLPDRAGARREERRRRAELWDWFVAEASRRGLESWAVRLRRAGVPGGDTDTHRDRLAGLLTVLDRLPADGVALPALAADALGDPHALDRGTWTGRAVVEALAARRGHDAPHSAEEGRAEWAASGVAADMLSPAVLVIGLAPRGRTPLTRLLNAMAEHAEPVAVTLSQLRRWPLVARAPVVHVFENPSLMAEAAQMGWSGPPLVCTSGWPNVAVLTLLRRLGGGGSKLLVHCDLDPKGIEIASSVVERVGATPWRMTARDYDRAVVRAAVPITGRIPDTPWDPRLAEAMRRHRRAVFEEDLRHELLHAAAARRR